MMLARALAASMLLAWGVGTARCQGEPSRRGEAGLPRLLVVRPEALPPTWRTLDQILEQREFAGRRTDTASPSDLPPVGADDAVVLLDPGGDVPAQLRRAGRLVVVGEVPTDVPAARVRLQVAPEEVRRARELFLPGVRRLAVITAGGVAADWRDVAPELMVVDPGARSAAELLVELAPQVEALLLPDEPALVPLAESLLREAGRRSIAVLTTAPWIARSGAAVGVVPDLELVAWRVAQAAEGVPTPDPVPPAPARRIVDLGALAGFGQVLSPALLAEADLVLGSVGEAAR